MKNSELFHKTISILVKAYQNDTLEHGMCDACAVGNLLKGRTSWKTYFMTVSKTFNEHIYSKEKILRDNEESIQVGLIADHPWCENPYFDIAGYTLHELASIEWAFETAPKGQNEDDWMFNGLMKVCDALMIIHEANEEEVKEAKLLFVK